MASPCLPPILLRKAGPDTRVLLVHAPYPGRLKFDGQPTSLLCAASEVAQHFQEEGRLDELGYLDPQSAALSFYEDLAALAQHGNARVACISTSTAAIEEAAKIAAVLRMTSPSTLILAGGPHEDDCADPIASRISDVDLSIGGDAEDALAAVVRSYLDTESDRETFVRALPGLLHEVRVRGAARVTAQAWGSRSLKGHEPVHVDDMLRHPWTARAIRFDVFGGRETLPLMISRGCAYGRCTFCAEAGGGTQRVARNFSLLEPTLAAFPNAALYFQDSIFPASREVRTQLLPMLRETGRQWGCQVFLPTLSRSTVSLLAEYGCSYIYTGLESGSMELRACVGKPGLRSSLVEERLGWLADMDIQLGISLMFGAIDVNGRLLESEKTVAETMTFATHLLARRLPVAGFYPNVLTILPGTVLAGGIKAAGYHLDYYKMPRVDDFESLEDGAVGYNFASIPGFPRTAGLVKAVSEAASLLEGLPLSQ